MPSRFSALRATICVLALSAPVTASPGFVATDGAAFTLDGVPFTYVGTNTYYLSYQDGYMLDDVFSRAARNNFSVLRTWAWLDIGYPNGTGSVDGGGSKNGVWFRAWDPDSRQVVVNETGLVHLDAVVAAAKKWGVKLILTLTNNWRDFGGMDQMVRWATWADPTYTNAHHDDFYVSALMRGWYKDWVTYLTTRVNTVTGVAYKDEPAIMAWELANEPRCQGSGDYGSTNNCTINYAVYDTPPWAWKITGWVAEMSAFVHAQDPNHLVAVGDEGFLCEEYQTCPDVTCDCYYGTDARNFTLLSSVDFMSLHLYPSSWGKDTAWGTAWIQNHTALAHGIGKPVVVGEFGVPSGGQSSVYSAWTQAAAAAGTNGMQFWMLCGREDDSSGDDGWYPNYDGFCVYCANATDPSPPGGDPASCSVLAAAAAAAEV